MVSEIVDLLKFLKEPITILAGISIIGLFYLLIVRERQCVNCGNNLAACNVTLTKLTTLIEVLLYKGGKKL
jgi:hypothetical protein